MYRMYLFFQAIIKTRLKTMQSGTRVDVRKRRGSWFRLRYCAVRAFGEVARPTQQSQGALNNPSLGKDFELMQHTALDHFDLVAEHLLGPFDQLTCVTTVNEQLGGGIDAAEQPYQHSPRSHPVLDTLRGESSVWREVALRIDRDVPTACAP